MRKLSIVLLGLIGVFSIIGLSPVITINAQEPHPHLNLLALYARGLTTTFVSHVPTSHYAFFILQNNIAFAWGAPLGSGVQSLGHGWYAHLGLSKYVETIGSPFYFLSVQNLQSVGSIYPGVLEVYNDSEFASQGYQNGICDTHLFGVGANISEVKYYLHLANYTDYDWIDLSPRPTTWPSVEVNPTMSSTTYTWGINYTNVGVRIIDAKNWASVIWNIPVATAIMDYMNISYELKFSSNGDIALSQNLHFGDISEPVAGYWDGLSLSVIQFNFAQSLSFDLRGNVEARNETGHIVSDPDNTTIFRTAKIMVGHSDLLELDLATTKENYTLGGTTNYSVKATSVPWYTAVYDGHIEDKTYEHDAKWHRTVTAFQHRICYNQWNGSKIDHDPIYGMDSPIALLLGFTVNKQGWVPSFVIGGIIAAVAGIILIVAVVIHRREK